MTTNRNALILLLTTFILSAVQSSAQNDYIGDPHIESFNTAEYKATYQNWSVAQDNDGLIYVANQKELLQYDGASWNIIKKNRSATMRYLAKDSNGRIYGGGFNTLGYIDRNEDGELYFNEITAKHFRTLY